MPEENTLSPREQEILQLVARGLTNREIAQELSISPNTVKVHVSNIFEKAGVASRTEAALYGMEQGIVDVPGGENEKALSGLSINELIRKYRWVWGAMLALLIVFGVTFATNVLFPPSTPETAALIDFAERWQELSPMPKPRAGMAAVPYDGNIYALAGEGPEGVSGEGFRYLVEEDRWESLRQKPTPVTDVAGVLIGERIYIPGGKMANGRPTNILEIYDPRADTWGIGTPLPKAISAYALADFEGKLYVFGGWDGEGALDDVYIYDPALDSWQEGTPLPTARFDAGAVVAGGRIFVVGGWDGEKDFDVNISISAAQMLQGEGVWNNEPALPMRRFGMSVINLAGQIYVFDGSSVDDVGINQMVYSLDPEVWSIVEDETGDSEEIIHSSVVSIGEYIYLVGGKKSEGLSNRALSFRAIYSIMLPFTVNQ